MSKKQYNPGKLWPIIKITVGLIKENPALLDNPEYLKATLKSNIEELNHSETCANCGASMLEYMFEFDVLDALLLLAMARKLNERLEDGVPFTDANKIRTPELDTTLAIRCRTTQCSKLGLVAKALTPAGKHIPGTWVITKRGFDALKGRRVPKNVRVWRGKIEERYEETTTLSEVFKQHGDKVAEAIKRKKTPKNDYRDDFVAYRPEDWYTIAGTHEGTLI